MIHDDFRRIGDEASIAWSRVLSLGPFDVVNIDLCDGLASDPPHNDASIYDAVARLVALQARTHTPWLLLITTRIGRGMFDADAEERLIRLFRENVANCDGFTEVCEKVLDCDVNSIETATCGEVDLLHLMITAIGKWLSALAQAQAPTRVELASTHGYRVEPAASCEDLFSLALRFEPVIAASPDALSPSAPASVDECTIAKGILRRSTSRLDVDAILSENEALHEELLVETEGLLAEARYDAALYRSWLES